MRGVPGGSRSAAIGGGKLIAGRKRAVALPAIVGEESRRVRSAKRRLRRKAPHAGTARVEELKP